MVDSVKITNFKAIKNIELELSRFNIFVGSNTFCNSPVSVQTKLLIPPSSASPQMISWKCGSHNRCELF